MSLCKYNRSEVNAELVEQLAPEFKMIQDKLTAISLAVDKINAETFQATGDLEPDLSIDLEENKSHESEQDSSHVESLDEVSSGASIEPENVTDSQDNSHDIIENYREQVESLQLELNNVNSSYNALLENLSQKDQELQNTLTALTEREGSLQELESRCRELGQHVSSLQEESDSRVQEIEQRLSECTRMAADKDKFVADSTNQIAMLSQERESLVSAQAELVQQNTLMKRQIEVDSRLEALMWPAFMNKPELGVWKTRMEEALYSSDKEENVVVLIANLFNYNAIVGLGEIWRRRLFDVLHDFGRSFFKWCESLGYDREESVSEAKKWASEFTAKSAGEYSIEVPEPDEPFDQRTMVSYETEGASASRDVKIVKTWCIKDASGRTLKQAEVNTY